MFYFAGITISIFLSALLFSKKQNSLADKILACWLVVIAIHLTFFYLGISGHAYDFPGLLGVNLPLPLLHGPFLYLYALALTGNLPRFTLKNGIHFLPAFVSYLYLIDFFLRPAAEKIEVFRNKGAGYETYIAINSVAISISGILYVTLTAILHRKHRKKIRDEFSYTEKINLDWILYQLTWIGLIWIFVLLGKDNFVFGTAVLFVIFIGYFGNKQIGIFTPKGFPTPPGESGKLTESSAEPLDSAISNSEKDDDKKKPAGSESKIVEGQFGQPESTRKKYVKSGLSRDAALHLHEKLNHLMQNEKVFCESELTLTDLSRKLGTHPNYLSQVINEIEGKNFFDYINTLRTEEFKRLAADPQKQKFTLLSLAFECGFNSKSSFNKYFKKVTGLAPSEFMKNILQYQAA